MKKLLSIFLILFLSGICTKAYSQVMLTKDLAKIIELQQTKELKEQGYNDTSVKVIHIPLKQITLPDGKVSVKLSSNSKKFLSREYKKVNIYVDSNYVRSMGVPIHTKIYRNILIAKDMIMRNGTINYSNVGIKKEDILSLAQKTISKDEMAQGMVSLRMYKPGDILDKRFVKGKPDIVKNALVTVIFKSGKTLFVTVDGFALSDGKMGNYISVKNKNYKKVYTGKIIGTNRVLVEI